jgi:hypothetical protein
MRQTQKNTPKSWLHVTNRGDEPGERVSGQQQEVLHNEEGKEARVDHPGLLLVINHDQQQAVADDGGHAQVLHRDATGLVRSSGIRTGGSRNGSG